MKTTNLTLKFNPQEQQNKDSIHQLIQRLINQNINQNSADKHKVTATASPLAVEVKANLEKFIAEGKSNSGYKAFLKNPNLLQLLEASANSEDVQALRNLVRDLHVQQNQKNNTNSASNLAGNKKAESDQHQMDERKQNKPGDVVSNEGQGKSIAENTDKKSESKVNDLGKTPLQQNSHTVVKAKEPSVKSKESDLR